MSNNQIAEYASVKNEQPKPSLRARIVEKIRSELNIEKWPAIWQPAKSKNRPALRTMEREMTADDGSRVVSRVEVGFTQLGTLTTEEQKLLYVLIKLWEDGGKPDAQVFFSTRALARMLKKKGWGTNVIDSLTKSLRKLRTIPVEWINSYFDQTERGAVVVDRRPFTILGDLRIVERRQDGAVNSSLGYFKFDDHILSNLLHNYTKPVCIEEFFKLKSEIAQLVYSHVDLMLADKTKYERRTQELFNDLGLKNSEYQHMYERKRALERALAELQGIRLSTGILRTVLIEKTKDGKDYKVVFQKNVRIELDSAPVDAMIKPTAEIQNVIINNYTKPKNPIVEQAETAVRFFPKTIHGLDNCQPLSKETSQALALVTQHGLENTKHIIEYAVRKAAETNFSMQHFGAVLSYASRAIAEMDHRRSEPVTAKQARVIQPPIDQIRQKGEQRLSVLTAEQYGVRAERTKAELISQNPFLARTWKDGGSHEKMVRGRIIRELAAEPMELMVPPAWLIAMVSQTNLPQNLPI